MVSLTVHKPEYLRFSSFYAGFTAEKQPTQSSFCLHTTRLAWAECHQERTQLPPWRTPLNLLAPKSSSNSMCPVENAAAVSN